MKGNKKTDDEKDLKKKTVILMEEPKDEDCGSFQQEMEAAEMDEIQPKIPLCTSHWYNHKGVTPVILSLRIKHERPSTATKIGHCVSRIICLITSGSCDDPSGRGTSGGGNLTPHINISQWEVRHCLLIRQILIPIFEVPPFCNPPTGVVAWERRVLVQMLSSDHGFERPCPSENSPCVV
ncbi:hypothetical protein AVEN_206350-1 [Araneus ventricosus]|uniref:Uncharacterized protein n=1 Tax=Araneus ventricosus TaxID=182803 RepID=A0A4Y2JDU0_ARAVE|nr:hypothetical protein AVEN_206350-1 [Araneus ventricosus]